MSDADEVAIVVEFEKNRARLRDEQDKAVEEESELVAQLGVIDVERKATIERLDAKRKELLRTLKEERRSVLSEIKKRRRTLLGKIQSARNRQQRALNKIQHFRGVQDIRLARLRSSKLKRKAHEDEDNSDDQEDDNNEEEEDDDEIDDKEEAEDPEMEEWKRLSDSFKNRNKDIVVGADRRKAVCRAFHELEALRVVAPPPYTDDSAPQPQPQSEIKTLEQLLAAIRKDEAALVYKYGPDLLNTSAVEELAARNDSTHDGVLCLPGVRALVAALTSPDCSWRTLKLLVEWAKASGSHAEIYDVREMERYWVAGFKGLAWRDASSSSSSLIRSSVEELLPQSYVPKNRMDKKIVRDWELDVLVPIIDIDSDAVPDSDASSEESVESVLHKIYQTPIPDENLRRLVNQASKLFEVCRGRLVSGVYHRVLATDENPEGWDLEERRGRLGRKKVQLNDKESDAARRVVRACWRLE